MGNTVKQFCSQLALWCTLWAVPCIAARSMLPQQDTQDQNKQDQNDQKDQKGDADQKSQQDQGSQQKDQSKDQPKDQPGDGGSPSDESSSSSSSSSSSTVPGLTEELSHPETNYNPRPADQDVEVGTFYMHKGDLDAAIPRFEDAIRLRPSLAKPYVLLAEIYEKRKENANAVKYYKEYLQVFPHAPDAAKVEKKIEKLTAR
jgi:tetratricopeptide (TPR) repeat protein